MNEATLRKAVAEANEFVARAKMLLSDMKQEGRTYLICGSALSGSVRRQSLELTRALAEVRKP